MTKGVYSVYDDKADAFLPPFTADNDAVAMRMVALAARDPRNPLAQAPGDYNLFQLGSWNPQTGELEIGMKHDLGNVRLISKAHQAQEEQS